MAAPHVAGAWTLLRAAMPNASSDQLQSALQATGVPVTRTGAGFTVPRIQVGRAIDYLFGRNRSFFNQAIASGAAAKGNTFLRIYNRTNAAGVAVVTLRDAGSGAIIGKWTSASIPAGASPQIAIATIESNAVPAAGQSIAAATRTAYNIEVESNVAAYVQTILWNATTGVFANLTSCRGGPATTDAGFAMNVNSSAVQNYVSRLRVTNTGPVAAPAVLAFADAASGASVATWTSQSIPPSASIEVAVPDLEASVAALGQAVRGGLQQYNVTLQSLNGYLQHVMENRPVAALTDITARCAVQASTAVAAN
jgi:hypothetical protein